jgi:hypothetical protein
MREKLSTNFDHRLTDDKSETFTEVIEVLVPFVVTVIPTSEVVEILSADLVREQSLIFKVFIIYSIFN